MSEREKSVPFPFVSSYAAGLRFPAHEAEFAYYLWAGQLPKLVSCSVAFNLIAVPLLPIHTRLLETVVGFGVGNRRRGKVHHLLVFLPAAPRTGPARGDPRRRIFLLIIGDDAYLASFVSVVESMARFA